LLQGYLGQRLKGAGLSADFCPVEIRHALRRAERWRRRSIELAPREIAKNSRHALYPQYAASTTASAFDAVAAH